ncbi:hypothetical protein GH714_038604 [Hevea brasiliensis]|uniref:Uncharacterized protein n=1 Tax=Hevea brasiliensis TaxID=3981 RepID=A0A6A6NAR5_HEVBR|nr:hypothetical protein GH714_038604 [Hevea brasiliensis]
MEVLVKFGMQNCKEVNTPLVPNEKLSIMDTGKKVDASVYRSLIGCLLYLSVTRPDAMYAISMLSRFMQAPRHIDFAMEIVNLKASFTRKGGLTPLHYAAEKGNLSILREFYKGCPESIKDVTFQGDTALHIAAKNHHKDAFEFLLMEWLRRSSFEDADFWEGELLNWKNKEGKTVLHIAASDDRLEDRRQTFSPSESSEIKIKVKAFAVEITSEKRMEIE